MSWSEKRKEKIIKRYREKSKKGKKMNKNQQRQPVLHTDITLGRIAYSSIRAEFADVIKTELNEAYGIDYSDSDAGIKELRNALKKVIVEQHGNKYERSFHPTTEELASCFPFSILFENVEENNYL